MKVIDYKVSTILVEERQKRPEDNIDNLIASIEDVGLLHPIVVGGDGRLKVGFRRLTAYQRMGCKTIPAHVTDNLEDVYAALRAERDENIQREALPSSLIVERARELEEEERRLAKERQAHGMTAPGRNASGNFPEALDTGKATDKVGEAFGISGKTYEHAKEIVDAAADDPETFGDLPAIMDAKSVNAAHKEKRRREKQKKRATPEPQIKTEQPGYDVALGQVWKCGRHTVICGNSYTLIDTIEADAMITDPPYGIDYCPDWNKWDGSPSDFRRVTGDDQEFNPAPFLNFPTVLLFGANYFSDRLPLGGWLCWDKRTKEELDAMFGSPFELAWYRSQHTTRRAIMIRLQHGGVVNADSESGNNEKRYISTQKPIVLMQEIIEALTHKGETILDPFSGSGSTLLACERTGNTCIAIELEPDNVAIVLQRYEQETGVKPCLE